LKRFKTDLHIHSCLSPCGDLDMSPSGIVKKSLEVGLNIIAICDHNSAENTGAAIRAGKSQGLVVLPGLEVTSREEVHVLAIFDREEQAISMQELVYKDFKGTNRPEIFGDQVVANEFDEVEGFNDRMLIGASQLALENIVKEIHGLGGLCVASHVDKPSFSIFSQLGFIPNNLELDALEISGTSDRESVHQKLPGALKYPLVTFSDAHFLEGIGTRYTIFSLAAPNVEEIRLALAGELGREVKIS